MRFTEAVGSALKKYATSQGRASRSEFWWFQLFLLIVGVVISLIGSFFDHDVVTTGQTITIMTPRLEPADWVSIIFSLLMFVPGLALVIRRLHDIDRSGWAYFVVFIPILGLILYIIWMCTKGTEGSNRFGDDPLAPA